MFLKKVHELLLGEDDFYVDVFRSLDVPYEAVKWRRDVNRSTGRPACSVAPGQSVDQHAARKGAN